MVSAKAMVVLKILIYELQWIKSRARKAFDTKLVCVVEGEIQNVCWKIEVSFHSYMSPTTFSITNYLFWFKLDNGKWKNCFELSAKEELILGSSVQMHTSAARFGGLHLMLLWWESILFVLRTRDGVRWLKNTLILVIESLSGVQCFLRDWCISFLNCSLSASHWLSWQEQ